MEQNEELLAKMYYRMNQARAFDERVANLCNKGKISSNVHLSIGQEASAVASCMALESGDLVTLTHRCHAQAIGFGLNINRMMADLFGKSGGYNNGKGGDTYYCDITKGSLGSSGISWVQYTTACGAALTQKLNKTGKIVLCFGGDGSTNEGDFHEALNMASTMKLPVVFFIENNYYSKSIPIEQNMNIEEISDRAQSYGIPGLSIDGNDPYAVYDVVQNAASYARSGKGPVLIESKTYRLCGHNQEDLQLYRTKEEMSEWADYDPIQNFREQLIDMPKMSEAILNKLEENAKRSVENAVQYAENCPEPSLETVIEQIYA